MRNPHPFKSSIATWLCAALFGAVVVFPFHPPFQTGKTDYEFEAQVGSSARGIVQLYYDVGRGFNETDSSVVPIRADGVPRLLRFRLPLGKCVAMRFDPLNRSGTITVSGARIVDDLGRVLIEFPPSRFTATHQIARMSVDGSKLTIETDSNAFDPNTWINLDGPLNLSPRKLVMWPQYLLWAAGALLAAASCALMPTAWISAAIRAASRRRKLALALTAALSLLLSSFPVIFFGRSFVSPNSGVLLLYDTIPTLPGYSSRSVEDGKGSDVGAVMWWHVPVSRIQRHAIATDHELPLWNRFDLCGQPLLGQGQSMIGDPLHWLTAVMGGGSALGWDVKYLAAKWIFAVGVGLLVLALTDHLLVSGLLCASSLFIGFFSFRLNHPAIFSLCYSPWILYSWVRISRSPNIRGLSLWTLALIASDWIEINSGTVKEAYILAAWLNVAGALVLLLNRDPFILKRWKIISVAWANLLFVMISAPVWVTFLDTLRDSFTSYDVPSANQLPFPSLIGFFEDLFYRQGRYNEGLVDPSTNFLILVGIVWAVSNARGLCRDRAAMALGAAALVPAALVYGIVPAGAILAVPFLRNVSHIDNTFSCVLIVLAFPLAGFGLKRCLESMRGSDWPVRFANALLVLAGLLALYFGVYRHQANSAFFSGYAPALICAAVLLQVAGRIAAEGRMNATATAFVVATCLFVIHWRHGQYLKTAFDEYVFNPQVRVDLKSASPAVEFVQEHAADPVRVLGLGLNLFPGYNAMYLAEGIYGIDALRARKFEDLADALHLLRVLAFTTIQNDETSSDFQSVFNSLNVGYFLGTGDEIKGWDRSADLDLTVFKGPRVWPRAYFVSRILRYADLASLSRMIRTSDVRPFAAIQDDELYSLPQMDLQESAASSNGFVPAEAFRLTTNKTSFRVVAPSAGVVVLTETWIKDDFRVRINGRPAGYFRVNHAFKGVYLDGPGTFEISFEYWPRHLTASLWASATGLLLLGASTFAALALARRRA